MLHYMYGFTLVLHNVTVLWLCALWIRLVSSYHVHIKWRILNAKLEVHVTLQYSLSQVGTPPSMSISLAFSPTVHPSSHHMSILLCLQKSCVGAWPGTSDHTPSPRTSNSPQETPAEDVRMEITTKNKWLSRKKATFWGETAMKLV